MGPYVSSSLMLWWTSDWLDVFAMWVIGICWISGNAVKWSAENSTRDVSRAFFWREGTSWSVPIFSIPVLIWAGSAIIRPGAPVSWRCSHASHLSQCQHEFFCSASRALKSLLTLPVNLSLCLSQNVKGWLEFEVKYKVRKYMFFKDKRYTLVRVICNSEFF